MTLPVERRLALLDWADRERAWIVEDDYDGEFHHRGLPPPALKSLDRRGRVLYVGSFSKVLFPGLRLGYLVLPSAVAERFARVASAALPTPPIMVRRVISRAT
jgi:GntR family transcriptional regulator/MocR family aminotransferase